MEEDQKSASQRQHRQKESSDERKFQPKQWADRTHRCTPLLPPSPAFQFFGNRRVAEAILGEVNKIKPESVFYFPLAEVVQVRLPVAILSEVVRHMFGQQNMSGIAAIHYPLRHVDSGSRYVGAVIHIADLIDRATVNAHS